MKRNVKHFVFNKFGGPEVFEERFFDISLSPSRDVLVSVERIGINPVDTMIRSGEMSRNSNPEGYVVLGSELQGEIIDLYDTSSPFKVGDKVIVKMSSGAYAEEVAVNHQHVYKIPDTMPLDFAAGFSSTAITAYWAINGPFYDIKPNHTIGVVGASGAVGSFIVQLLKDKAVKVVAVASQKNKERLLSLGAGLFIDYSDQKAIDDNRDTLDYVMDASLFNSGESVALDLLKDGGTYLAMTRMPNPKGNKRVVSKFLQRDATMTVQRAMNGLFDFYSNYGLSLPIPYILPLTLDGVKKAHELINGPRESGKIILSIEA